MKKTFIAVVSVLLVVMLCVGLFAECDPTE